MAIDSSPFHKMTLVPVDEGYSYKASVMAIQLPDGKLILNYDKGTKYQTLLDMARVLRGKIVHVEGTWSFTPTVQEDEE